MWRKLCAVLLLLTVASLGEAGYSSGSRGGGGGFSSGGSRSYSSGGGFSSGRSFSGGGFSSGRSYSSPAPDTRSTGRGFSTPVVPPSVASKPSPRSYSAPVVEHHYYGSTGGTFLESPFFWMWWFSHSNSPTSVIAGAGGSAARDTTPAPGASTRTELDRAYQPPFDWAWFWAVVAGLLLVALIGYAVWKYGFYH